MTCPGPRRVLGCDIALRHAAVVLVDEVGQVLHAAALVTGAGAAARLREVGVVVQRVPSGEQTARGPEADLLRLCTLRGWLDAVVAHAVAQGAVLAVLEGIAPAGSLASGWQRLVALSQASALARLALADGRLPHVVVPPTTVGKVLHDGKRQPKGEAKIAAARVVRERYGLAWAGDDEGDLVDAYVLARSGLAP